MSSYQNLDEKDQNSSNAPQMGSSAPMSTVNPVVPTQNHQKQGSGRFTNIQSYLNANKGAGQQLSQGISNQVQKKIEPIKTQANDYNAQVRQGIQGAQNTLNQGQQQLGQLKQIGTNIQGNSGSQFYGQDKDLGINQFTQSPDYSQYQKIQAGQGVNEDVLNMQQQAFQNQSNKYNQLAQDQANQVASEGGRFGLLKQSFGGNVNPKYSSGQQRLDQVFLARQGLGDLRNNLQKNITSAKGLQAQTQETGQGVRSAQEGEKSLINNINTQAGANEADYLKMLESYIPEVNKQRDQQYNDLASRYAGMAAKTNQAGGLLDKQVVDKQGNPILQKASPASNQPNQRLTADDLKLLGMTKNSQIFDVFNKTKLEQVADKGRQAAGYQDVANQQNVDTYKQLANIAKLDPGNIKLQQAGNLGAVVSAKQGAANLQNRLNEAANTFYNNTAANDTLKSKDYHKQYDSDVWGTIFGDPAIANKGINLKQILSGQDIYGADRKAGSTPIIQAKQAYNDALAALKQYGAGNVLTTEGNSIDALKGITSDMNNYRGNQGEWNKGQLHKFNSNLDESFMNNLAALGIKNPYTKK
jgi:hypothetical protein